MGPADPAPLAGIRILDLTRIVSGPFGTMLLADLGAEIVKVEEPGSGDESRRYGPPFIGGESAYFLSINRGKRSIAIDLKNPAGRDIALRLAGEADALVENFRPGTMDRLGLGEAALRVANPDLVYVSISGFGRSGPDAGRPGYDLIVQGESGVMDITGAADGPPTKVGTSIADLVTGMYAAQAVLAGLLRRGKTGTGGRVDVAMLDAMASLLTFNAGIYFATGASPRRRGNAHPTISPYETFEAEDGWINVSVANDKLWRLFCDAMKLDELPADERFRDAPSRVANRFKLKAILDAVFIARPRRHWIDRLAAAGIPCGEIKTVAETCTAPQLVARGMIQEISHPAAGVIRHVASALRFDDAPPQPAAPPPLLGADTDAVLRSWLELEDAEIAAVRSEGAFGR